ncbi:MAG: hypothetical protein ACOCVC_09385 [Spirochaeta sp.]
MRTCWWYLLIAGTTFILISNGCGAAGEARLFLSEGLRPPIITSIQISGPETVEITCDTPIRSAGLRIEPQIEISDSRISGSTALFTLDRPTQIGMQYALFAVLEGENGHTAQVMRWGFGYNPRPVDMIMNEVIVRGSGNNPDAIEILIREGGNLGGSVWYLGTDQQHDAAYLFPPIEVNTGDYLILHVRPEHLTEEIDETGDELDLSGGKLSHPLARDLWLPEEAGLPSNNGVLTLYRSPHGELLDAILYSNRTHESDQTYGGFGTAKMQNWVNQAVEAGGWNNDSEDGIPLPEECVSPEGSTGTRSLNRGYPPAVTRTRHDWHIVPTRGATIGEANSNEVHSP